MEGSVLRKKENTVERKSIRSLDFVWPLPLYTLLMLFPYNLLTPSQCKSVQSLLLHRWKWEKTREKGGGRLCAGPMPVAKGRGKVRRPGLWPGFFPGVSVRAGGDSRTGLLVVLARKRKFRQTRLFVHAPKMIGLGEDSSYRGEICSHSELSLCLSLKVMLT